jgi:sodium/proline symporter
VIVLSFCFFLLVFTLIGLASLVKSRHNNLDYLLAGRQIKPWLVGLSAVATNNSGYMFTGMIGFTYMMGLSAVWLMVGWILGDLAGSFFIHKRLRIATESSNQHSFTGVLSHWNGADYRKLRFVCGLISVIFMGAYAAAQLNAGSKALHVLFGWDLAAGAVIGSIIVLAYCFAGGIRASIWTDAAQSVVMIMSMTLLLVFAIQNAGGTEQAINHLREVNADYMSWAPLDLPIPGWLGLILFLMGWCFAGFGVVGQPHIMIRFMALDKPQNIAKARFYYYSWFVLFYAITIVVGLMARILIPQVDSFDSELALPMMSTQLLPPILAGLMLAGLFAATMSTADSLILSCSASLTRDFFASKRENFWITKLSTVLVTFLALGIALNGNKSVFQLVLYAWAVLAAAFGPLLIIYCLGQKVSEYLAIAMVLTGSATVIIWTHLGWSRVIYEIVPGILAGLLVFVIGKTASQYFESSGCKEAR